LNGFSEFLFAFNAHRVKYPVVGGYAVSFYELPIAMKSSRP